MPSRRQTHTRHLRKSKAAVAVPRNNDIAKRLDQLEARIAWLDEHGTRGVEGLRVQLGEQAKDIAATTTAVASISTKLDGMATIRRQQIAGAALALLPIYVLLFMALFHVQPV